MTRRRHRAAVPALVVAIMLSALVVFGAPRAAVAQQVADPGCARHWTAIWAASPSDATAAQPPVEQTFRSQVYAHHGGRRIRIHLSNRFGTGPVTFGAVSVGLRGTGASTTAAPRPALFQGRRSVTVAPGRDVVSDPLAIRFRAFQTLLVSVYVVHAAGPATEHVVGEQTTYRTAPGTGDHTADADGAAFDIPTPVPGSPAAAPQGVYYLSGVDAITRPQVGGVVAFGDSITDGFQGTLAPLVPASAPLDRNGRYPDFLARRAAAAGLPVSVVNAGISGNQLLRDYGSPIFGPSGLHRLHDDALSVAGTRTLLLMEGINDIGQSAATAKTLVAGYRTVVARAHRHGIRVLLGTLTPDGGTLQPGYGLAGERTRRAVNSWIRRQHVADGVVDFDAAVRDPAHPDQLRPEYDGGDHLHLSRAGYRAMARAVPLRLLSGAGCS